MPNVNKAHSVNDGLLVDEISNGPFYTGGAASPVGQGLPFNTIYVQTVAGGVLIWQKFGAGDTSADWRLYPAGSVSFDVSSLTGNSADLTGLNQTQAVVSALANRHFGKNYGTAFTAATVTTSSGAFATIQTITPSSLPSGTYLFKLQAIFQKTLSAGKIETRFLLNGGSPSTIGHVPLPDDDFDYVCQSEAIYTTSGSPTVTFQWRKSAGGGNIIVKDRRLDVWRLS